MWGKPWSEEDVAQLRLYVAEGLTPEEIGRKMDRPAGGIKTKIKRIKGTPVKRRVPWTKEDLDKLVHLKESAKLSWDEISARLNRPSGTVYSKYEYLKNQAAFGPRHAECRENIPALILTEQRHRQSLTPRDLTAAFFGDPLPGYSALDRRGAS